MDKTLLLSYGCMATLVILLIIFEIVSQGGYNGKASGYSYYTCKNTAVRIRHMMASQYRIYIKDGDFCPAETSSDRYGTYFKLRARTASEAENRIDELYRG